MQMSERFGKHWAIFGKITDKRSLRWHDINRVNGHHTFGIEEKVIMSIQKIINSR